MREYSSEIVLQPSIITTNRYDQKACLDGFGVIHPSLRQQTSLDSTGKCSMKRAKVSGNS